jgi:2-polyprenyl-3-methyl-5-hydroxy-6-metoxy-1,4-benzoquinol methylase
MGIVRAERKLSLETCIIDAEHSPVRKAFVKNGTDIYFCHQCGCLMADVQFYHDQYENDAYYTMRQRTKKSIENKWGIRWRYLLRKILRFSEARPQLSLLDVGAGNGYFLSLARNEFSIDAKGLEISKAEIRFAKEVNGVDLINQDVTEHRTNYDVVTCFNVIEHVVDPQSFLSAMVRRINPGGMLVISTPNPRCARARIKGLSHWERVDPPHHINLFSKNALVSMMKKNGLVQLGYETISTYITFVNTNNLFLRRFFFWLLRIGNLGADHFLFLRMPRA